MNASKFNLSKILAYIFGAISILIFGALLGSSYSRKIFDNSLAVKKAFDGSLIEIQACLLSGRDCAFEAVDEKKQHLDPSKYSRSECFNNIKRLEFKLDTENIENPIMVLECEIEGKGVIIEVIGDLERRKTGAFSKAVGLNAAIRYKANK